jgi:hypothetical protein
MGVLAVNSLCYVIQKINIFLPFLTLVLCFENVVTPSATYIAGSTRPLSVELKRLVALTELCCPCHYYAVWCRQQVSSALFV